MIVFVLSVKLPGEKCFNVERVFRDADSAINFVARMWHIDGYWQSELPPSAIDGYKIEPAEMEGF